MLLWTQGFAQHMAENGGRGFFLRVSLLISVCTLILTASFVGVLSFLSGHIMGLQGRTPWYIVVAAVVFVATVILLEGYGATGQTIIVTAIITTAAAGLAIPLAIEGVYFAIRFPEEVFVSQLVLYFFAAGLFGTGLGYWGLNHWREFTGRPPDRL